MDLIRLRIQITGFLKDVVDGLGVRNPQAIFLHAHTNRLRQKAEYNTPAFIRRKTTRTPKGPLQRTMFPKSSRNLFSGPPVSSVRRYHRCPWGFLHSVSLAHRREGSGDVPKIQDGFTGPGTSLTAEDFLCLRRRAYTKIAVQVASAPS